MTGSAARDGAGTTGTVEHERRAAALESVEQAETAVPPDPAGAPSGDGPVPSALVPVRERAQPRPEDAPGAGTSTPQARAEPPSPFDREPAEGGRGVVEGELDREGAVSPTDGGDPPTSGRGGEG